MRIYRNPPMRLTLMETIRYDLKDIFVEVELINILIHFYASLYDHCKLGMTTYMYGAHEYDSVLQKYLEHNIYNIYLNPNKSYIFARVISYNICFYVKYHYNYFTTQNIKDYMYNYETNKQDYMYNYNKDIQTKIDNWQPIFIDKTN